MLYEITYLSKYYISPGHCLECPLHFINLKPEPGEPATGCELTGEFLPDEWDIENIPWDKCPVTQCEEYPTSGLDKFGKLVRDIRITRSLRLYDIAKELGLSPAELSAIECGRKPVPDWFIPALDKAYGIGDACVWTLELLAKNRGE